MLYVHGAPALVPNSHSVAAHFLAERQEEHFQHRSLGCLQNTNYLRGLMISFIEWPWFDRFILSLILINCVIQVNLLFRVHLAAPLFRLFSLIPGILQLTKSSQTTPAKICMLERKL